MYLKDMIGTEDAALGRLIFRGLMGCSHLDGQILAMRSSADIMKEGKEGIWEVRIKRFGQQV